MVERTDARSYRIIGGFGKSCSTHVRICSLGPDFELLLALTRPLRSPQAPQIGGLASVRLDYQLAPPRHLRRSVLTITVPSVPRLGFVLGVALVAGLVGGFAGGVIALQLDDDPALPEPSVAAPVTSTALPPTEDQRLREAIARVLPAVVTIVVDLPDEVRDGVGVVERRNFGSGIVVSGAGHVITNFHVIEGAQQVTVVLQDGERRPAQVIADDAPFTDLAILVTDPTGLRAASLGDSRSLELGEPVAAISSGLITFENQVKLGVLSARVGQFPRDGVLLLDMLQTDARINNGDSGGALVSADGEVVGLLTVVVRESEGRQIDGVSIAHSAESIRSIVEAVVATNVNPRARIGIERVNSQHVLLSAELVEALNGDDETAVELPVSEGALIVNVDPGSPADLAGVTTGDIVVGVDGLQVDGSQPFANLLAFAQVGVGLDLFVVRGDEQLVISVVPQAISGAAS